jgi:hypothetical protein
MTVFTYSRNSGNKKERLCTRYQNSGNHVAQLKESYNIKGLLPAPLMSHTKNYCLSGYSKRCPHLFIFYTITTTAISFPAIRKIKIALPFHQVEAIATRWPALSD